MKLNRQHWYGFYNSENRYSETKETLHFNCITDDAKHPGLMSRYQTTTATNAVHRSTAKSRIVQRAIFVFFFFCLFIYFFLVGQLRIQKEIMTAFILTISLSHCFLLKRLHIWHNVWNLLRWGDIVFVHRWFFIAFNAQPVLGLSL